MLLSNNRSKKKKRCIVGIMAVQYQTPNRGPASIQQNNRFQSNPSTHPILLQ